MPGNLPRVLPDGLGLRWEKPWPRAPIFDLLERGAGIGEAEMRRTFNMGIGYVFVVAAAEAGRASDALRAMGESPIALGHVVRVGAERAFEDRVEWPA
jgi:phosphoribosylformylglycinamidine cyclo-ligase